MYLLTLAATLGKWCGIVAAEALWVAEMGVKPSVFYYATSLSVKKVSEIATQHAIDSTNPEKVTDNLFDCLEFID